MITLMHRRDFPKLIDSLGLKIGVEVGVAAGRFSTVLLQSGLTKLYMVDSWLFRHNADNRHEAVRIAEASGGRAEIFQATSLEAASQFEGRLFDFIYLDASHDYNSVKADLEVWWSKVRQGGILSGHDYQISWPEGLARYGVVPAVEEFAEAYRLEVHITGCTDTSRELRLRNALRDLGPDTGPWGDDIPSFWVGK